MNAEWWTQFFACLLLGRLENFVFCVLFSKPKNEHEIGSSPAINIKRVHLVFDNQNHSIGFWFMQLICDHIVSLMLNANQNKYSKHWKRAFAYDYNSDFWLLRDSRSISIRKIEIMCIVRLLNISNSSWKCVVLISTLFNAHARALLVCFVSFFPS